MSINGWIARRPGQKIPLAASFLTANIRCPRPFGQTMWAIEQREINFFGDCAGKCERNLLFFYICSKFFQNGRPPDAPSSGSLPSSPPIRLPQQAAADLHINIFNLLIHFRLHNAAEKGCKVRPSPRYRRHRAANIGRSFYNIGRNSPNYRAKTAGISRPDHRKRGDHEQSPLPVSQR